MDARPDCYIRGAPAAALLGVCSATVLLWGRAGRLGEVRRDPDGAFLYSLAAVEERRGSKVSDEQLSAALNERQQIASRVRRTSRRRYSAATVRAMIERALTEYDRRIQKQLADRSRIDLAGIAVAVTEGLSNATLTLDTVSARGKRTVETQRLKEWNESPGRKALGKKLNELAPAP